MSEANDANTAPSDVPIPTENGTHTDAGAPTDQAQQDAGDGTLTGSVPAGLTADELREQASSNPGNDGGTG